jgi:hypothetical protein
MIGLIFDEPPFITSSPFLKEIKSNYNLFLNADFIDSLSWFEIP